MNKSELHAELLRIEARLDFLADKFYGEHFPKAESDERKALTLSKEFVLRELKK